MKKYAADLITLFRIPMGIALLFFPLFSFCFFLFYLLGGVCDVLDGMVARRTNTVSDFGSRLDTAADFVFFAALLWKILPAVVFTRWASVWVMLIVLIKAATLVFSLIRHRKTVAKHTVPNKLCGVLLFLFPLILYFFSPLAITVFLALTCVVATVASVHECYLVLTRKESRP